jgi:hypothetical protein
MGDSWWEGLWQRLAPPLVQAACNEAISFLVLISQHGVSQALGCLSSTIVVHCNAVQASILLAP